VELTGANARVFITTPTIRTTFSERFKNRASKRRCSLIRHSRVCERAAGEHATSSASWLMWGVVRMIDPSELTRPSIKLTAPF
jgi:hypothetical protein